MKLPAILFGGVFLMGGCTAGCAVESAKTSPATQAAGQSNLKAVDLRTGIYLARLEIHTTISPDGWLRSVRTEGKSYGPGDIDPKSQRIEMREGRLTRAQMTELAALFSGWESISREPFGGVADGEDIELRYANQTVSGGSAVPKQVLDAVDHIKQLAAQMPVVVK